MCSNGDAKSLATSLGFVASDPWHKDRNVRPRGYPDGGPAVFSVGRKPPNAGPSAPLKYASLRMTDHLLIKHLRYGRWGSCLVEFGDVDGGLGFGDGAVVDLHLGGFAEDEQAQGGFAAGGNVDAPGY